MGGFQVAHLRGARPRRMPSGSLTANFNPRTHVGCDLPDTHRRGCRADFNPRTRVGCDTLFQFVDADNPYFNPRTRVGCDGNKAQKHFILFLLYYTASPMYCQFAAANPPLPLSLLPCNCPHAVRRYWGNPVHLPFAPGAVALWESPSAQKRSA